MASLVRMHMQCHSIQAYMRSSVCYRFVIIQFKALQLKYVIHFQKSDNSRNNGSVCAFLVRYTPNSPY